MAVKIVMPSLGMYTIEGELTRWLVAEGTQVKEGQQILELTTEKTTVEIEAPAAGILHQVLSAGQQTKVEGLLGYILTPGELAPAAPSAATAPSAPTSRRNASRIESASAARYAGTRMRVSPIARRRAGELGLDLSRITGTGPGGRITEADVEATAASGRPVIRRASSPSPPV